MRKVTGARDIKLIAVGNSMGIRLPKTLLQKYGWSDSPLSWKKRRKASFCTAGKGISSLGKTRIKAWPWSMKTGTIWTRRSPMAWIDGDLSQAICHLPCRPQSHRRRRASQGTARRGGQPGNEMNQWDGHNRRLPLSPLILHPPCEREKRIEQVMRGMNQAAYDRRQWELDPSKRETLVKLERLDARQSGSSRRVPAIPGQRGTTGRRADIEVFCVQRRTI